MNPKFRIMPGRWLPLLALLPLLAPAARGADLLNYQGRVITGQVPFQGSGQFKFALMDATGSVRYWTNSADVSPADGVPDQAVSLTVTRGLFSVLLGDSTLPGMAVIPAAAFDHDDLHLRVWFNDGTNGWQILGPDQRIAAVGYSVMAGNVEDKAITGAKFAAGAVQGNHLASGAVTGGKIAAGSIDSGQIAAGAVSAPQLAGGAAAGSLNADGLGIVPGGALVMSAVDDNPDLLSAGYVKLGKVDLGAEAAGPFGTPPSARHSPLTHWTGSELLVWGGAAANGQAIGDGAKFNPATNTWAAIASSGAPSARFSTTSVWTGSEMIVWGGTPNHLSPLASGARYSPATNTWAAMAAPPSSPISPWGVPLSDGRFGHAAAWVGGVMIVWGGSDGYDNQGQTLPTLGGYYNPSQNTWGIFNSDDYGLPGSMFPKAVLVQDKVYFVGGRDLPQGGDLMNSAVAYDIANDEWFQLPAAPVDLRREDFAAVAAGDRLMVWGGRTGANAPLADGATYNPATGTWSAIPALNAPSSRWASSAAWTGNQAIIWGGGTASESQTTGARFDPVTGVWSPMSAWNAPAARSRHAAVWTGSEMIVWGGTTATGSGAVSGGASYHPAADQWRTTGGTGRPRIMTLYLRP